MSYTQKYKQVAFGKRVTDDLPVIYATSKETVDGTSTLPATFTNVTPYLYRVTDATGNDSRYPILGSNLYDSTKLWYDTTNTQIGWRVDMNAIDATHNQQYAVQFATDQASDASVSQFSPTFIIKCRDWIGGFGIDSTNDIVYQGVTGPQGDTGIAGATGDTGVQGITGAGGGGATGIQGATGAQGSQGDTGVAGVQGATGVQGDQGDTGVAGVQGSTGVQGDQGATGVQGDQGATGVQGEQGDTGVQGVQGDTGVQGDQGDTGVAGADGAQGDTGAFSGSVAASLIPDTGCLYDLGSDSTRFRDAFLCRDMTATGRILAGKDTNTTSYFGRAAIGYAATNDYATFSHHDLNTSTGWALEARPSVYTRINGPSAVQIAIGGTSYWDIASYGIRPTTSVGGMDLIDSDINFWNSQTASQACTAAHIVQLDTTTGKAKEFDLSTPERAVGVIHSSRNAGQVLNIVHNGITDVAFDADSTPIAGGLVYTSSLTSGLARYSDTVLSDGTSKFIGYCAETGSGGSTVKCLISVSFQ